MSTITWKDPRSGKKNIQIIHSKDTLEQILQTLVYDGITKSYSKIVKDGKKKVFFSVEGISYDSEVELALFRKYGLVPAVDDYPMGGIR